jgi:hypothetical protein
MDRERLENETQMSQSLEDKISSLSSLLEDQAAAFGVERQDLLRANCTLSDNVELLEKQSTIQMDSVNSLKVRMNPDTCFCYTNSM